MNRWNSPRFYWPALTYNEQACTIGPSAAAYDALLHRLYDEAEEADDWAARLIIGMALSTRAVFLVELQRGAS